MEKQDLYSLIFKRKSIRKYDLMPLDKTMLSYINSYIKSLTPLYSNIETEINIVSKSDVKGLIQVNAPHYIAAFSEVKEGYLTNLGFMLQQLDLFFSASGLGCCWQGWPKPTKELRTNRKTEFTIVLAFGLPKEILYRQSIQEFNRKPFSQITTNENFKEILEPARLAPSPSQPWYFAAEDHSIHVFCRKTRGLKAIMFEKLDKIEIGIAVCHMWIAAMHFNKPIEFISKSYQQVPKGYNYIISAEV